MQQQHPTGGDDRRRITRAREAAEALFAPKRQAAEQPGTEAAAPADQAVRKPRILTISAPEPVHREPVAAPVSPGKRMKPVIPVSQIPRIRTWMEYGMTTAQVAQLYGVAVGEIERISRKA